MTLFERLRTDLLHARKTGNTPTAEALRFVVGEGERLAKSGTRDKKFSGQPLTEAETVKLLQATVLNLDSVIGQATKLGRDTGDQIRQREVFQGYLPRMLTERELHEAIDEVFLQLEGPGRTLALGDAMRELAVRYQGRYDGTLARTYIQSRLAPAGSGA